MSAEQFKVLIINLLMLLRNGILTAIMPAETVCPASGCFQNRCWDFDLIDGHVLHAICVPENNYRSEIMENNLDLNLCVGISDNQLVWQDGGNFARTADFMSLVHAGQFKDDRHIILHGYCPDKHGPRFNCMLDVSELVWIDDTQLGCFHHRAKMTEPFSLIPKMPVERVLPVPVELPVFEDITGLQEHGVNQVCERVDMGTNTDSDSE